MSKTSSEGAARSNSSRNDSFEEVLRRRLSRRGFLKGAAASAPFLIFGHRLLAQPAPASASVSSTLMFESIPSSTEDTVIVPPGYTTQAVIRWGEPLHSDVPPLDILNQTAELQARQFGYNCDFVGYFPLQGDALRRSLRGLLAVNNEFPNSELMFPGYVSGSPTQSQVDIELAALGVSIVEVVRLPLQGWQYHAASAFNRRITGETEVEITGPARGHDWLKVSYNPSGTRVRGTFDNCAGGKTPWGTLLSCEENFQNRFANSDALPDDDPKKAVHSRYGLPSGATLQRWELFHPRFDLAQEPNEPFRFGWVVEIDPYNPTSIPKKRTALGRFRHEGATVVVAQDGRVVVYSGDDQRFDYMYKFVSDGAFNPDHREANFGLLDAGTLYVARFNEDGSGEWLPLVFGQEPLTSANGFASQADVLINARGAADQVGATMMDRPEDIETNPVNGKVYCVMTNNNERTTAQVDAANPRANNIHGHIIELTESGDDAAATTFTWEIFMLCGDPTNPADDTFFAGCDPSHVSPISSPDNITFDGEGNLWIATDGQPSTLQQHDGIYAVPVAGDERGCLRQFLSGPAGCELCGPEFSPDGTTLFCAIQHPGEGGTLEAPISTWPDGTTPPRPAVIAVVKPDGGSIGS